jgi:hypothetical protein
MSTYPFLLDGDNNPIKTLAQYYHDGKDFQKLLNAYSSIDCSALDERASFFVRELPDAPLLAGTTADRVALERIREANEAILGSLKNVPGRDFGIGYQSLWNFRDLESLLYSCSPAITGADVDAARDVEVNGPGFGYLFLQTIYTSDGHPTELHFTLVIEPPDGNRHFLEAVWNPTRVESADKDVVDEVLGKVHANHRVLPPPNTLFEQFHGGGPPLGHENLLWGGDYQEGGTLCDFAERYYRWELKTDRQPGERMWPVTAALEFSLSPDQLRRCLVVPRLIEICHAKGSVVSCGIHYVSNSCFNVVISCLFDAIAEGLANLPAHEIIFALGRKATRRHWCDLKTQKFHRFFDAAGCFYEVDEAAYEAKITELLNDETLKTSFKGQPPYVSKFFVNDRPPADPANVKLYEEAIDLEYAMLKQKRALVSHASALRSPGQATQARSPRHEKCTNPKQESPPSFDGMRAFMIFVDPLQ